MVGSWPRRVSLTQPQLISSFVITLRDGIDSELISFVRLLTSDVDWKRARKTEEPPSGKIQKLDAAALDLLSAMIEDREARYNGTLTVRLGPSMSQADCRTTLKQRKIARPPGAAWRPLCVSESVAVSPRRPPKSPRRDRYWKLDRSKRNELPDA